MNVLATVNKLIASQPWISWQRRRNVLPDLGKILFGWKEELRASGVYMDDEIGTYVHGEFVAGQFHSQYALSWRLQDEENFPEEVQDARLYVCIPRELLAVRYLHLPSQDPQEVRSMARHQLAGVVPVGLEELHWNCCIARRFEDGSSVAYIQLVRRTRWQEHLRNIRGNWTESAQAISESSMLAHVLRPAGDGETVSGHCVLLQKRAHVLILREGRAVFHYSWNGITTVDLDRGETPEWMQEVQGICEEAAKDLGCELSRLWLHVLEPQPQMALDNLQKWFQEHTKMELQLVGDSSVTEGFHGKRRSLAVRHELAIAALESGKDRADMVLNGTQAKPNSQPRKDRVIRHMALSVCSVILVLLFFGIGELLRDERRAERLGELLVQEQHETQEIKRLTEEVEAMQHPNFDQLQPASIIANVQKNAPPTVRLDALGYSRGDRLSLRGRSPDVPTVILFAESLSNEEQWDRVRILGIHQGGTPSNRSFSFEIEADPVLDQDTSGERRHRR